MTKYPKAIRKSWQKGGAGKKAPKVVLDALHAAEVLRLYAEGGNRETFVDIYGVPVKEKDGKPLNAEQLLAEAIAMFTSDEARTKMAARVVARLSQIGFSDVRDAFKETGELKPMHELPDDIAAAVAAVDISGEESNEVKKLRLVDRFGVLKTLAQISRLLVESHEVTGKNGGPIRTEEVEPREVARRLALLLTRAEEQE